MGTSVFVMPGIRRELPIYLRSGYTEAQNVGIVVDERVFELWPVEAEEFSKLGFEATICTVPRGEDAKTRETLSKLQDELVHLRRDEPIAVIGGGSTTDVGGFAAATIRRGLPWIAVPTTVIGMADASIGGKVAVNHPQGKNLLGGFHPADVVLADPEYLSTLEPRDQTSGMAEIAKCARIGSSMLWQSISSGPPPTEAVWALWINRAVQVKEGLVAKDPLDVGERRLLNYGHTVGHALETRLGNEGMRHGEAIAIGMEAAMAVAGARGLVDSTSASAQTRVLKGLGLPVTLPGDIDTDALMETVGLDKKRRPGDRHTFVLPTGRIGATVVEDVTDEEIQGALDTIR